MIDCTHKHSRWSNEMPCSQMAQFTILGIGFAELIYQYMNIVFTVKHIINDLITLRLAVKNGETFSKKH